MLKLSAKATTSAKSEATSVPTKKESVLDAAKKVEANAKRIADLKCVHWDWPVVFFSIMAGRLMRPGRCTES